nr:LD-carboxypeptidase [Aquibacillus saliphilus]
MPSRIKQGDTIGIIAPASPPDLEKLQIGIAFLKSLGLQVKIGNHISAVHGYLAGTDQARIAELHTMFADKSIKGIICACGGYGTARLADGLDYSLIANNPKVFWGYSDITFLHTAINKHSELVTFHGPMLSSDIAGKEFDGLSKQMFLQLFTPNQIIYSEKISKLDVLAEGTANGVIVGGNLTLLTSSLKTPFEIDTLGKLLLIEDVDEEPYRIDAMLNQLRLAGKLADAVGIVIGNFKVPIQKHKKPTLTLEQVLDDYFANLNKPVIKGFHIGHCLPHIAIPLGVQAKLSTENKTLKIAPGVM